MLDQGSSSQKIQFEGYGVVVWRERVARDISKWCYIYGAKGIGFNNRICWFENSVKI